MFSELTAGRIKSSGEVYTVAPDTSVSDAAAKLRDYKIGSLVVVDTGGKPIGIITERDIVEKVVAKDFVASHVTIKDVMTNTIISITPDTSINTAKKIMTHHHIRHLPVIDNGRLCGIISSRDILTKQLKAINEIARHQSHILAQLEDEHPGITDIKTDSRGRIVI